jgi:hypothetical protein
MQASCGNSAREWASHQSPPVTDFRSQLNTRMGRCFVVWTTATGGADGWTYSGLADVNANEQIGFFMLNYNNDKPRRCEVELRKCDSMEEWNQLVTTFVDPLPVTLKAN